MNLQGLSATEARRSQQDTTSSMERWKEEDGQSSMTSELLSFQWTKGKSFSENLEVKTLLIFFFIAWRNDV